MEYSCLPQASIWACRSDLISGSGRWASICRLQDIGLSLPGGGTVYGVIVVAAVVPAQRLPHGERLPAHVAPVRQ
jgi:hypothetical protein